MRHIVFILCVFFTQISVLADAGSKENSSSTENNEVKHKTPSQVIIPIERDTGQRAYLNARDAVEAALTARTSETGWYLQSKPVRVNVGALLQSPTKGQSGASNQFQRNPAPVVLFEAFGGLTFELEHTYSTESSAIWSWNFDVVGGGGGGFTIGRITGHVTGVIRTTRGIFEILPTAEKDVYALIEFNSKGVKDHDPSYKPAVRKITMQPGYSKDKNTAIETVPISITPKSSLEAESSRSLVTSSVVRVLVLFSDDIQASIIEERAGDIFESIGRTFANSNINVEFVHFSMEIPVNGDNPSTSTCTVRDQMFSNLNQFGGNDIHDLRDSFYADAVMLLVKDGVGCGCATIMQNAAGPSAYGYAVVKDFCAILNTTAAHEMGHVFGGGHVSGGARDSYSRAHQSPAGSFETTLVSTNSAVDPLCATCLKQEFFSDPDRSFAGHPRGTSTRDNVRTLESAAPIVAQYRPDPPVPSTASCNVPIFLGCHHQGCAGWLFSFAATNATEYRLDSRQSGGSWIFNTMTTSTTHAPHLAGVPLQWRIRGENSSGPGNWCYFWTTGECELGGPPINN